MKKLFNWLAAAVLALAPFAATADIYTPYDGPSGMTHHWYNKGGAIRWNTAGGDYGAQVAQIVVPAYRSSPVVIDITAAGGAEGILISGTNPLKFRSREATAGPGPFLTIDGQPSTITVVADANLTTSSTPVGTSTVLAFGGSAVAVYFSEPLPVGASSITITFDVHQSYSYPSTLTVSVANVPRLPDVAPAQGLAAGYTNDAGIDQDPRVLLNIDFDNPDWNAVTNWRAEQPYCQTVESANSLDGGKVLQSIIDANKYGTGCSHHAHVAYWNEGVQIEEAYMRYYVRLDANYYGSTDGGKMPGVASEHWYDGFLLCGGGGTSCAGGKKGWTLRGGFNMSNDVNNPIYPGVPFHTYAYHANQVGEYGDFWSWGPRGVIELEKWVSVEQHIKLNTPGVNDGIYEVWIDGKLALSKTDIQLRGELPFDVRVGDSAMAIKDIPWIVHFYGGKYPPYVRNHDALFDKFVVATEYIGPMNVGAPVPDPTPDPDPVPDPDPTPEPTLEESVAALEARVTDAEGGINVLGSGVATLETQVAGVAAAVTALETQAADNAAAVATLDSRMGAAEAQATATSASVALLGARITTLEALVPTINDLVSRVTAIENRMNAFCAAP